MPSARRRTLWMSVQSALYCALLSATAFGQQPGEPAKEKKDEEQKAQPVDTGKFTVTGSRLPASVSAMPQSVYLIDSEDVSRQAAVATSVAEILQNLVPGISRATNTAVNTYTSVRGRKPVVLIDGAPVTSTLNDTAREVNLIDAQGIERIEVVPGSSALYGNSAGAGFINYVTKAGGPGPLAMRTEMGSDISMTKSTGNGYSPSVRQTFSGAYDRTDYRLTALYGRINDFYDANGNIIPPQLGSALQDSTVKSAAGKVGYNFGRERVEGSLSYYSQVADILWAVQNGNIAQGIPASAIRATPQPGQVPEEHEALVGNLVYSNAAAFGTSSSFRAQAYYVDTTSWFQYALNRFPLFPAQPSGQSGNMTKKSGARFDINTPLQDLFGAKGTLLWGLDLMRDNTKIPLVDGRQFGIPQTLKSVAGFVQRQVRALENLQINAGVRHESSRLEVEDYLSVFTRANITGGELKFDETPVNIGAVYSVTKSVDLYAGFSQGFDIQQTSQNFRAWPVNINLAQTKPPANVIDSYEVGARYSGNDVRATLGFYQIESSNGISYSYNAATPNEPRAVVAPDRIRGVEMTLDYTGWERWIMGMTYARSEGKADTNNDGSLETPLQNRRIPPPAFTGHVEYDLGNGSYVRVQGLFSRGRNEFPNTVPGRFHEGKVNPYNVIDVIARFAVAKNADLTLGIRNLFNEDYYTNYSEGFNTNDNYLKAPGRTFSVRLGVNY